jgi:phospholipid/cholesterol/gamma-HCH transport system ATP-binding protein
MSTNSNIPEIEVKNLTIGYDSRVILKDLNFTINQGEIVAIMGGSGCGKSTLLKRIIGLVPPMSGDILIRGKSIVNCTPEEKREIMRSFGVTYQGGALFGSMTVGENVALPLEEYTNYSKKEIAAIVKEKLSLVDLANYESYMPSELSGGMCKRAGLARALALNPTLLFFDEPSAGLDPITSAHLDKLILSLKDRFNVTVVIVSHELDSIFTVADRAIMLDKETKTIAEIGTPEDMKNNSSIPWVREFLNRAGLKRKE